MVSMGTMVTIWLLWLLTMVEPLDFGPAAPIVGGSLDHPSDALLCTCDSSFSKIHGTAKKK